VGSAHFRIIVVSWPSSPLPKAPSGSWLKSACRILQHASPARKRASEGQLFFACASGMVYNHARSFSVLCPHRVVWRWAAPIRGPV
jgi:hypothetical protein